jgi:hypothetical protein
VKPNNILDIVDLIGRGIKDCEAALAFPLALLPKAKVLIGLTRRVYLVDDEGRVWVHHPWSGLRGETPLVPSSSDVQESYEDYVPKGLAGGVSAQLFYVI